MRGQLEAVKGDLDREQTLKANMQQHVAELSTTNLTLENRARALRAQVDYLESDSKQQSDQFADMEARMQDALRSAEEARQKLIKEETERRILFNKYQELKGNIRVMCRVRPVLEESEGDEAKIMFPDLKTSAQVDVMGPEEKSSLGVVSRKTIPFEFDRVFSPGVSNEEVFDEISPAGPKRARRLQRLHLLLRPDWLWKDIHDVFRRRHDPPCDTHDLRHHHQTQGEVVDLHDGGQLR